MLSQLTANNLAVKSIIFTQTFVLKKLTNPILAIATGLLLFAGWPVSPFTFLVFFAWIPLLWLETKVTRKRKFLGYTYLAMFTWNITATWWIWNATSVGAIGAFFANSFLMCLPWLGFKIVKTRLGEKTGYLALIAFWMCFEFLHLQDWGLSWPWLTLGNSMAVHTEWIQWYEYTGTSGGTLWILIVNIFLFLHIRDNYLQQSGKRYRYLVIAITLLVVPLGVSYLVSNAASKRVTLPDSNIVVVQPNIDPWEKVSDATGSLDAQLNKLIAISEKEIDDKTTLVVWPETAVYLANGIDEDNLKRNKFLDPLWGFLQRHPSINLFTGLESYRVYDSKKTKTARPASPGFYYDSFNGSVLLDSSGPLGFYHKSRLVPGAETLPWFLRFLDTWFEKFGGTTAGYAKQDDRTVLVTRDGYRIAPAICYESIYGEFMSQYVANGANILCIITNDGWWGNTPGYKQHLNYARLRAIETRKWVARSANTGISCFIDPFGNLVKTQPWETAAAIKMSVPASTGKTFYVRYGDILSRVMVVLSIFFVGYILCLWIKRRFFKK